MLNHEGLKLCYTCFGVSLSGHQSGNLNFKVRKQFNIGDNEKIFTASISNNSNKNRKLNNLFVKSCFDFNNISINCFVSGKQLRKKYNSTHQRTTLKLPQRGYSFTSHVAEIADKGCRPSDRVSSRISTRGTGQVKWSHRLYEDCYRVSSLVSFLYLILEIISQGDRELIVNMTILET